MVNQHETAPTIDSAKMLTLRNLWSTWTLIVWAVWWGGLTFYAIVVVPIGTELIGSVDQGFITQQATWWHNCILFCFVVCLAIESIARRSRLLSGLAAALLLINLLLILDHAHLTTHMDFDQRTVPTHFYARHATYLWITAIEWCLGIISLFALRSVEMQTMASIVRDVN